MRKTLKILAVGLIAACGSALPLLAQETPETPATTNAHAVSKAKHHSFRGKVASVDKTAKTITLEGKKAQVVHVTSQTKITKEGKPATLDDIVPGGKIAGAAQKSGTEWDALTIRLAK